jgi:hypothetical protein
MSSGTTNLRIEPLAALVVSGLSCLFLVAPGSSTKAAINHVPAAERPCRPDLAPCDVTLQVENDRGIPQRVDLLLPADVNNPTFYPASANAPLAYSTSMGQISFNLTPGSYHYYTQVDSLGRRYGRIGPFRLPLPAGADPLRVEIINYGISAGDEVLITRNPYIEGLDWSDPTFFPEGLGVSYQVPAAGSSGKVILPSFGFPQSTPQLTDRERGGLGLINDARRKKNLAPLPAQPDLNAAADGYACWLATPESSKQSEINIHERRGSVGTRAVDYGWPGNVGSEAIYWGSPSAERGVQGLMNSPPHLRLLLADTAKYVGLGHGCGHTVVMLSAYDPQILPFSGIGGDIGDSSLARWTEDTVVDPDTSSRFRPTLILRRPRSQRPILVVRANGSRAFGRLEARQGDRQRWTDRRELRIRVRPGERIHIRFIAASNSMTKSGQLTACLKKQGTTKKVRRCR